MSRVLGWHFLNRFKLAVSTFEFNKYYKVLISFNSCIISIETLIFHLYATTTNLHQFQVYVSYASNDFCREELNGLNYVALQYSVEVSLFLLDSLLRSHCFKSVELMPDNLLAIVHIGNRPNFSFAPLFEKY